MPERPSGDVRPDLQDTGPRIFQTHLPQYEVWAFGQRVRGTGKPYSDIDLVILTQEPLPLSLLGSLQDALPESDLAWHVDVDVVDWAYTCESFRSNIEQNKVVVKRVAQSESSDPLF